MQFGTLDAGPFVIQFLKGLVMISIFVSAALLISGVSGEPQLAANASPAKITCKAGPLDRNFGGVPWLVFACSDHQSLLVISTPAGLDGSFYFIVKSDSGTTNVMGEGDGNKQLTDAANAELHKLSAEDIHGLLVEAEAKGSQH
jgi:hypothetical protein